MKNPVTQMFIKESKNLGLKITKERLEILKFVQAFQGHFDADDLLLFMRNKGVRASRATIYRTLDLLVQFGFVRKEQMKQRRYVYEYIIDRPHHEHLICENCGKITEITNKELEKKIHQICQALNFQENSHLLQVYGYCQDCQQQLSQEG